MIQLTLPRRRRAFGLTLATILLIGLLSFAASLRVHADGSVSISQQCSLASNVVHPADTLVATGTLRNLGTSAITLPDVVLAGRPPLGTHDGGPFDDFAPHGRNVLLAPGQSLTL